MKDKFYITTSIAYVNAPPHLGYALELVQADVLARHRRSLGEDVFFLTGTDEHGIKIAREAEKQGKAPEVFSSEIGQKFADLAKKLNASNDDFIRTTEERHKLKVKKVWEKLVENGDIELRKYKGFYCVGCEAFVKERDLVGGKCPVHQKEPEIVEEENYFFNISKYIEIIKKAIESNDVKIIPEARGKEAIDFIDSLKKDSDSPEEIGISVSRPKEKLSWGIPVPEDESQTIYIWFEALINYLFPEKYWPADIHCIGKDIVRFHALVWPAILLAYFDKDKSKLPKNILVHGFVTHSGKKMSKSLGNVVDPFGLIEEYGADAVRYFLLREIPSTEDGDFTYEKFKERYNSDLANGLGNLLARLKKISGELGAEKEEKGIVLKTRKKYKEALGGFRFNEALSAVWGLIGYCDKCIEKEKPWEGGKDNIVQELLGHLLEISELLSPFLPETSNEIKRQIRGGGRKLLFPRK